MSNIKKTMSLEYFYNLIQLFGVLLGLVGVFIVFKIQSLDANIHTYRNNLITSIAQYEAGKSKHAPDKRAEKEYDELVSHYYLVYNGHTDETLKTHVDRIINELNDTIQMQTWQSKEESTYKREYFRYALSKWDEGKSKKNKFKYSIKYSIFLPVVTILLGLSIAIARF